MCVWTRRSFWSCDMDQIYRLSSPICPKARERSACLVDRVFAVHVGSRGFAFHRRHMSERFFRSNKPRYPHQVRSELENSGTRLAVGDCCVTELRRWRPLYQASNCTCARKNTTNTRLDARCRVCGHGSVPLNRLGNVVTRIGLQHQHCLEAACQSKLKLGQ